MFKKSLKNRLKINVFGVNLKRLIKTLHKNNIDIYGLEIVSHKELFFEINAKNLKKIKPLLKNYEFKITKRFGISYLKDFFINRFALMTIFVIFFVALFLNVNFLGNIYIYGTKQLNSSEIEAYLKSVGIQKNTFFNNINIEELEVNLENEFPNISLCSVMKKGTNLIINIKEKIEVTDLFSKSNILAQQSGQIVELNVVQGTAKFKVGDSVNKGDIIVEGVILNAGKEVECKAIAEIKMKVWYSESVNFYNEEIVTNRTGRKIENTYYEIFNKTFKIKEQNVDFEKYEKEEKTCYLFKNLIVPIKIHREIYYEIEENLIKNDFSLQKNAIIDTIVNKASSIVPKDEEILNTKVEISDTDFGKIIYCYVETIISFN